MTIVQPLYSHLTIYGQPQCGSPPEHHTISVETLLRLHWHCTISVQSLHSLHMSSLSLSAHTRNCMMPVHNVNAYTVAHSHLQCLKNCTENRRPIYRREPGTNMNQAQESKFLFLKTITIEKGAKKVNDKSCFS